MAASEAVSYIPGTPPQRVEPLGRYLPPFRNGVLSSWLESHASKGSWLLDPFGIAPNLALEAAQAGYKILVAAHNPIVRFILELKSSAPSTAELQAAVASLAATNIGDERLEPHLKALYTTSCEKCDQPVEADTFLWKRGESAPYGRIYTCPYCSDSGERPSSLGDQEKAQAFAKSGLHKARALERVAPLHDPDRVYAEEALAVYLPRAIYALTTIINKLASLPEEDPKRRLLSGLLLLVFDRANTLWPYPKKRQRPRQLTIPPQFCEHNLWKALEAAVQLWASPAAPVPLTRWPDHPPDSGGICVFEGRFKELAGKLAGIDLEAVVTAFPRPNQAFWTLSALWAGWLWGPEAVEHFKSVLRRRRYDWNWHTTAMQSVLSRLRAALPRPTPCLGLIDEVEPGFLSAVVLGANLGGLQLSGLAMRTQDSQAQLHWMASASKARAPTSPDFVKIFSQAARQHLLELRGEPAPYLNLHAAGLASVAEHPLKPTGRHPGDLLSQLHHAFHRALTAPAAEFRKIEGGSKSIETGLWWLRDIQDLTTPLSDRVEMEVVRFLLQHPICSAAEIDATLCGSLPGLTPPDPALIQICLESYGTPVNGRWILREADAPAKRRQELEEIAKLLFKLGKRLGFEVSKGEKPPTVHWNYPGSGARYIFHVSAAAILGKYLLSSRGQTGKFVLVLPGSRSNIVAYKRKRNPYLDELARQSWAFLKYRHLRQMAESPTLTPDTLDEQLTLDPLTYSEPQIRLF